MFALPGHLWRMARAAWVLAREGVFTQVDPLIVPAGARPLLGLARLIARKKPSGQSGGLAAAIVRLGPSYVKLGQFLATRPDICGMKIARELEALQDRVPPFARADAVSAIETAFDTKLETLFSEFSEPIAAASIAQVHRARITGAASGDFAAVKILRPGVDRQFRRDLAGMYFAANMAERFSAEARRLRFHDIVATLDRSVRIEMDLRLEAAAASEFAANNADDPEFVIPQVDWDRTAQNVLTTQWIEGIPLSHTEELRAAGHDLPRLGRIVIQSFLRHAIRDGLFHADMHQGNLFVDKQGRVVAVDFGIMGRLGRKEQRFLAEILFGFITRNYRRVAEVHFEAGYVPPHHSIEDFALAIRAIGEPIHSRTADQISMAKLLTLLFEITSLFDMKTRTELVMLQKTMVVVEGVARALDPKLDIWATAEPVVGQWIRDRLGPAGMLQDAASGLAFLGRAARQIPDIAERAEALSRRLQDNDNEAAPPKHGPGASFPAGVQAALWIIAALMAYAVLKG